MYKSVEPGEAKSQRSLEVVHLNPNVECEITAVGREQCKKSCAFPAALQRKEENLRQHQTCLSEVKVRSCCANVLCCNVWLPKGRKHFLLSLHSQLAA